MKTTTKWLFGFLTAIILLLACSAVAQVTIHIPGPIPSSWFPMPAGTTVQVDCAQSHGYDSQPEHKPTDEITRGSVWKEKTNSDGSLYTVDAITQDDGDGKTYVRLLSSSGHLRCIPGGDEWLLAYCDKIAPVPAPVHTNGVVGYIYSSYPADPHTPKEGQYWRARIENQFLRIQCIFSDKAIIVQNLTTGKQQTCYDISWFQNYAEYVSQ